MTEDDYSWIAPLLHFADSTLPVGAYAHSFGLEGMVQLGQVTDVESFETFLLRDVTHALLAVDIPLTARAHIAAMDSDTVELQKLDQLANALRPTRQLRSASSKIGRQQYCIYSANWERTPFELPHYHASIVMGLSMARQGVPVQGALYSVAYQTYSALLQASLKLIPIGPAATQRLLQSCLKHISPQLTAAGSLQEDEIGSFNPLWDIAASSHERAPARLFLS